MNQTDESPAAERGSTRWPVRTVVVAAVAAAALGTGAAAALGAVGSSASDAGRGTPGQLHRQGQQGGQGRPGQGSTGHLPVGPGAMVPPSAGSDRPTSPWSGGDLTKT